MFNKEQMTKNFENHVATLQDFGILKLLDFKHPDSNEFRIRFIFEEDHYKLHISGDLGSLSATNATNMTLYGFKQFVGKPDYFAQKIDCMERAKWVYDEGTAEKELLRMILHIDDERILQDIVDDQDLSADVEEIKSDIDYLLHEHFNERNGLDIVAIDKLTDEYGLSSHDLNYVGQESTGIIETYLLAYELAAKQLNI